MYQNLEPQADLPVQIKIPAKLVLHPHDNKILQTLQLPPENLHSTRIPAIEHPHAYLCPAEHWWKSHAGYF